MDTSTILFVVNAFTLLWIGVGILYALAKGLPLATENVQKFKELAQELAPALRRIFDPNTALAKALKAKGIDPEFADKVSELTADTLLFLLKHTQPEEAASSVPHKLIK
jgi:hypothetical protein